MTRNRLIQILQQIPEDVEVAVEHFEDGLLPVKFAEVIEVQYESQDFSKGSRVILIAH